MQAQWLQATNGSVYTVEIILLAVEKAPAIEPQADKEVNCRQVTGAQYPPIRLVDKCIFDYYVSSIFHRGHTNP